MADPSGRPGPSIETAKKGGRREPPATLDTLFATPGEFSFSQAVRLLRQAYGQGGADGYGSFLQEQLRVRPFLSLGFPGNDLVAVEKIPDPDEQAADEANRPQRFQITATFLGLYGPSSPLPTYYTEELLDEQSDDRSVSRDFLDLLNQGFFVLFSLADIYYRLSRRVCEEADEEILSRLFALTGLGHPEMRDKIFRHPGELLRTAGLLTQFPRSAAGLRALLADRIGAPVQVRQCEPREAAIPSDQWCCLSRADNALGQSAWIGPKTPDAMGKIAITVGPLSAQLYRRYLPGSPEHDELLMLIRFYCTQPLAFDLALTMGPAEAQPGRIGESQWSQLGCDVWLMPDPQQESCALFQEVG